jgi:hypothetical protein
MALNFLGLGFLFSAKDDGLKKSQDDYATGFGRIGKAVSAAATNIAAYATTQGKLQSDFEANMMHQKNSIAGITTGLDVSTKEAKKYEATLSQMAYDLNREGALPSIGAAFQTIKTAGIEDTLKEIGVDLKGLVKIADVSGTSVDTLASSIQKMKNTFGMTNAEIKMTLDTIAGTGKAMNVGSEAIRMMPEVIDAVGDSFVRLARSSPQDAQKAIVATEGLAAAFTKFLSPDQAKDASKQMLQVLTGETEGIEKMFTGLRDNVPGFTEALSIGFQSADQAFDMIKSDPVEFTARFLKMVNTMKANGQDVSPTFKKMAHDIGEMNTPLKFLMMGSEKAAEAVNKVQAAMGRDNTGAFAARQKDYRINLELQQSMDRIGVRLEQTMRGISPVAANFVKEASKNAEEWNKQIKVTAGKGGLIGQLLKGTSEFMQLGPKAFLPAKFQPFVGVMGQALDKVSPLLDQLNKVGLGLGDIFSVSGVLKMGLGAILGDFLMIYTKTGSLSEAFKGTGADIKSFFTNAMKYATKAFNTIKDFWSENGPEIKQDFDDMVKQLEPVWAEIKPFVVKVLGDAFDASIQIFETLMSKAVGRIAFDIFGDGVIGSGVNLLLGKTGAGQEMANASWEKYLKEHNPAGYAQYMEAKNAGPQQAMSPALQQVVAPSATSSKQADTHLDLLSDSNSTLDQMLAQLKRSTELQEATNKLLLSAPSFVGPPEPPGLRTSRPGPIPGNARNTPSQGSR